MILDTVNSEIIACIYYWECLNGDENVSFIFAVFQKVSHKITAKFRNVSSNFGDYNPFSLFAIIKTSQ